MIGDLLNSCNYLFSTFNTNLKYFSNSSTWSQFLDEMKTLEYKNVSSMMENPLAENREPTQMTNLSPGKVAIPFENIELEDDTIGGGKYNWLFL